MGAREGMRAELDRQLWGQVLKNPVGLAAGFDKDGEAIDGAWASQCGVHPY